VVTTSSNYFFGLSSHGLAEALANGLEARFGSVIDSEEYYLATALARSTV